jgi:hypothetical protein
MRKFTRDDTEHGKEYYLASDVDALMAQPELYDQTALELCEVCGWKTLIPSDGCLNCERKEQPEERNFCPRCGKRTADLTTIHTCTPPQENT